MKESLLWALIVLNAVLLAAVVKINFLPTANAQVDRPSDYLMLPGEVPGGSGSVVYVIDTGKQQLSAMTLDQNGRVEMMPAIDLRRVYDNAAR